MKKEYGGLSSTRMGKGRGVERLGKGAKLEGLIQGNIIMYFLKLLKFGK
jgi:hypothetical protein